MSLIVPLAYRLADKDYQAFVQEARRLLTENWQWRVAELIALRLREAEFSVRRAPKGSRSRWVWSPSKSDSQDGLIDFCNRYYAVTNKLRQDYEVAHNSHLAGEMWDLDACIMLHRLGRYWYLRPLSGGVALRGMFEDYMNKDSRLVEFSYWDSSDEPEGMDPRVWRRRKQVWRALTDEYEVFEAQTALEIGTVDRFNLILPDMDLVAQRLYEIQQRAAKQRRKR